MGATVTGGYPIPGRAEYPGEQIIGPFVTIQPVLNRAGDQVGITEDHPRQTGEPGTCSGILYFDTEVGREAAEGNAVWEVVSMNPLTLQPSILCPECGHHGHITDGVWVPS